MIDEKYLKLQSLLSLCFHTIMINLILVLRPGCPYPIVASLCSAGKRYVTFALCVFLLFAASSPPMPMNNVTYYMHPKELE